MGIRWPAPRENKKGVKMKELDNYLKAMNELKQLAKMQYTPETCPLNSVEELDHYDLAQALFGLGSYEWICGFCGQEFTE